MGNAFPVKHKWQSGPTIDTVVAREVDDALTEWFAHAKRDLSFRKTQDPYAIMVAEFMLQQTTVAAVEPYYERFLKRFPSVHVLAAATEDEVMQMWAGLGYYRRARQLRAAAVELVERWEGQFPLIVTELQALPGFGRYTAGAVLSTAYDLPFPILEANTLRVFARLSGLQGMVGEASYMKQLWSVSDVLVKSASSPRLFNVSAMELGALVCKPVPRCDVCPVQTWCVAYRLQDPEKIPIPRPRPEKVTVTNICIAAGNGSGSYLIRRIPKGEWHAGMWEFPTFRSEDSNPDAAGADECLYRAAGMEARDTKALIRLKYTVTHHKITSHVFHCHADIEAQQLAPDGEEFMVATLAQISTMPMGSAQTKLLKLLICRAAEDGSK